MDKWKILCWLSEVQVLLLPPVVSDFFPDNACDAEQCEWWCHPVGIECDRGDGRTKHTISHGQASPLWWLNIICEILHIISALRNIDPLTVWPLMNLPIKWNITGYQAIEGTMHLAKKVFLFRSTSRRGIMLTTHQLPTSTFETSDWAKSVLNDARRIDHQKKVSATKSCKKSVIQVSYLLFINSPQRGNHVSGHDVNIQGVIFNCSALKVTKCQTLMKFWYLFDGFYYVIWHLEL